MITKTPKWTEADDKRAEKMGWRLKTSVVCYRLTDTCFIEKHGDRFKSDDEAIEWVIECCLGNEWQGSAVGWLKDAKTCRKALFFCAKG